MAKKYVVENAGLNCQYGETTWLIVPGDRHIEAGGQRMGNETDYKKECFGCGGFGICHSPHVAQQVTQSYHDFLQGEQQNNLQQVTARGADIPCEFQPGPQWVDTKEDVYIAKYRALLEDSWTFCTYGLGFITLINSGQQENPADKLKEQLKELEAAVDAYVKENGLSAKERNDLLNSVVLWNGYATVPWDSKISQELWDFGIYMEKNHPALSNYFDRGIYLFDPQTGTNIDVSYMAGIGVALNKPPNNAWNMLSNTIFEDEAAYNGYLEACRQGKAENALEAMQQFLSYYNSPNYDGKSRYTDYITMDAEAREVYEQMNENGLSMDGSYYEYGVPLEYYGDPEEILNNQISWDDLSQDEKDLFILRRSLAENYGEETADFFINKVYQSTGKERP